MLVVYKNGAVVKFIVGTAQDTDTVPCLQEPNEVRVFTATQPNGVLLTPTLTQPPGLDEWYWDSVNSQVILGEVKTGTIVAYAGTVWLFEDKTIPTQTESVEYITVQNVSDTLRARDITLSAVEVVDYAGSDASMVSFSLDGGTTWSSSITLPDLAPQASIMVAVRFNASDEVIILRNIALQLNYTLVYEE